MQIRRPDLPPVVPDCQTAAAGADGTLMALSTLIEGAQRSHMPRLQPPPSENCGGCRQPIPTAPIAAAAAPNASIVVSRRGDRRRRRRDRP